MRLPNFLVVGAPKAGTTSMHRYLSEHPAIYVPPKKGLHYFTYDHLREKINGPGDREAIAGFCKTFPEYESHFADVPSQCQAIGDASPSYLYFSSCIPQIQKYLGSSTKIIIMIRNPIDRAFSMYLHLVRAKRETLSFYDALQAEDDRLKWGWGDAWFYKAHSLYCSKIKDYLEAFGHNNVKVIEHNDFSNHTLHTMQEVYSFLGVDKTYIPHNIGVVYGKTGFYADGLTRFLAKRHPIKTLARKAIPARWLGTLRNMKYAYINKRTQKTTMPDARSLTFLRAYFSHDVTQLEQLLQIDLSAWK